MSNRNFFILLFLAIIVYAFDLRLDIMEVDAAQYAEMSWEMLTTKSFLQVHNLGVDYLDKPPLLFWLSSLSMYVFGVNNFAFKFPSLLFALLAVYSTYRFSRIYYDKKTAQIAALILATSQAVFLITNDVRTDTILMGAVIFAIWQWAQFFETSKIQNLLLGSLGVGLALLAKGPIGLIATGAALMPHLLLQRKFKKLFDWRILIGVVIIAVLLLPMCLGLYQQFGIKGLTFYFWTQSFGRITGQSEWNNHPDTFFLVHTSIWALAPWPLFFFTGWLRGVFVFVKGKFSSSTQAEIISLAGFTLVLICLSLSKYQLPHYIFVVYPLAAIIAANCLVQAATWHRAKQAITVLQLLILIALPLLSIILQWAFKGLEPLSFVCLLALYPLGIWGAIAISGGFKDFKNAANYVFMRFRNFYNKAFGRKPLFTPFAAFVLDVIYRKIFYLSLAVAVVFNFLLSAFYFPAIHKYQPQNDFGRYIKAHAHKNFVCYKEVPGFSLVFYAQQQPVEKIWMRDKFKDVLREKKDLLVYASLGGVQDLKAGHIPYAVIDEREIFGIASMTGDFFNPNTRDTVCSKIYLLEVKE